MFIIEADPTPILAVNFSSLSVSPQTMKEALMQDLRYAGVAVAGVVGHMEK